MGSWAVLRSKMAHISVVQGAGDLCARMLLAASVKMHAHMQLMLLCDSGVA